MTPQSPSPDPRPRPRSRSLRRLALATTAAVAATATAGVWFAAGPASAGVLTGGLYRDTDTPVARWVAANPGDSRAAVIRDKVASQPASRWFSNFNLATIESETAGYVGAATAAGQLPVLTAYTIPNRDCGGASAGGAPDLTQYQTWVSSMARGIGGRTAIVILEPDSIALQTCLSGAEITARGNALSSATRTLKAAGANVYLDGGHSAWNSAGEQAARMAAAGMADADGFYTNASNFQPTASEASFGRGVIAALAGRGMSGKRQVIDTSRNGGASGDWCGDDNTDRRLGQYPTTATGDANIDAYLWIKPPGEADGCAFQAGSFQPSLAFSLANGATNPPVTTPPTTPPTTQPTTPPTTPPTTVPTTAPTSSPPTTGPTTPPIIWSCNAIQKTTGSWQGGFQGEITVTPGNQPITAWRVSWTLAAGQSISQVWGGDVTVSGSTVTVRNASWNGSLRPGQSASFGFIANGAASTPALTCQGA